MSLTLARNEVSSSSRWDLALLTVNVLGAITYVIAASRSWAIPQERGLNSTTGEPFVWALFVVPIFAVFAVVNLLGGGTSSPREDGEAVLLADGGCGVARRYVR